MMMGAAMSDRVVARREGERRGADRHQAERDQQAFAAAVAVHVGAEKDGAERARDRGDAIGAEREHERHELVLGREEGARDIGGEIGVDEEIVELEKIAGARPDDGLHLLLALFRRQHRVTPSPAGGRASAKAAARAGAGQADGGGQRNPKRGRGTIAGELDQPVLMNGVKPPKTAVAVTKASEKPVVRTFCGMISARSGIIAPL